VLVRDLPLGERLFFFDFFARPMWQAPPGVEWVNALIDREGTEEPLRKIGTSWCNAIIPRASELRIESLKAQFAGLFIMLPEHVGHGCLPWIELKEPEKHFKLPNPMWARTWWVQTNPWRNSPS